MFLDRFDRRSQGFHFRFFALHLQEVDTCSQQRSCALDLCWRLVVHRLALPKHCQTSAPAIQLLERFAPSSSHSLAAAFLFPRVFLPCLPCSPVTTTIPVNFMGRVKRSRCSQLPTKCR